MSIIAQEIKKLTFFIYILIFLFVINIFVYNFYKWEGFSIIVGLYVAVFSFYLIYQFSSISTLSLRESYKEKFGIAGSYLLFFETRLFPFILIYFITVVFQYIEHVNMDFPISSFIFYFFSGGYSKYIVYSLILFLILRISWQPKKSIPLFLILSASVFFIDNFLHAFFPSGIAISVIKFTKYILVLFILIYEFFYDVHTIKRAIKAITTAILFGVALYVFVIAIYFLMLKISPNNSFPQVEAANRLMRVGFSSPYSIERANIIKNGCSQNINKFIEFSKIYNRQPDFTVHQWENQILLCKTSQADFLFQYLYEQNIFLPYEDLINFIEKKSVVDGENLVNTKNSYYYFLRYINKNSNDLLNRYSKGNLFFKLWLMKLFANGKIVDAIPIFVDELTGTNSQLASSAYKALHSITSMNPAKKRNLPINNPSVVETFMNFYNETNLKKHKKM